MRLTFDKYSAHGNDFIIIDNREFRISEDNLDMFVYLCGRRTSVGADGIVLVNTSTEADISLKFYNSDGSRAMMCGNATRASTDFAFRNGIFPRKGTFEIWERIHRAEIDADENISVEIIVEDPEITEHPVEINGSRVTGYLCDTSVPHLMIFSDELFETGTFELARNIRSSDQIRPEGTNVSFLKMTDPENICIRTFEKGVEDFTLSCGTAAAATGFISNRKKGTGFPIFVHSGGGVLSVIELDRNRSMLIGGKVNRVYSGVIDDIDLNQF